MDARHWLEINKTGALPLKELEMLVEFVCSCSRLDIYLKDIELTKEQERALSSVLEERRKGRPIQYIIGTVEFADLSLRVDERALIPRPETEWIVEKILAAEQADSLRVLDIGSGSGCIALALKNRRASWEVNGVDVSRSAIDLAASNATSLGLDVSFYLADISKQLENVDATLGPLDILVSNPPYIPLQEKQELQVEVVGHEPHSALFAGNDPQYFYQHLARFGSGHLQSGGRIYLECHEDFASETAELFLKTGYSKLKIENDFNQKPRLLSGVWEN